MAVASNAIRVLPRTNGRRVLEMGAGNMNPGGASPLEEKVKQAIIDELKRQADLHPGSLQVSPAETTILVNGKIDLDDLTMVVIGALAGGP